MLKFKTNKKGARLPPRPKDLGFRLVDRMKKRLEWCHKELNDLRVLSNDEDGNAAPNSPEHATSSYQEKPATSLSQDRTLEPLLNLIEQLKSLKS